MSLHLIKCFDALVLLEKVWESQDSLMGMLYIIRGGLESQYSLTGMLYIT